MRDSVVAKSYAAAGVDLDAAAHIKRRIAGLAEQTFSGSVVSGPGGFGGVFDSDSKSEYLIVASTDSVGTKIRIAQAMGRHDTVGMDIVNHCVNDILPSGAEPLFFLDYIGMGEMDDGMVMQIVEGLSKGCVAAGCALIGGETAILPGLYQAGDYDLVGFVVGRVRRDRLLSNQNVEAGDYLLALPSSGLHTNGYSLVRSIFNIDQDPAVLERVVPDDGRSLGDALLEPHRLYLPLVSGVLSQIKSIAHITGGGLLENLPRALKSGVGALLDRSSWDVPPLFDYIQGEGDVHEEEMYNVFNMGVGMILVVSSDEIDSVSTQIEGSWVIGQTVAVDPSGGDRQVGFG